MRLFEPQRTLRTQSIISLCVLCALCGLFSCTSSRALPEEMPFVFEPNTEKYWLCNLITSDIKGHSEHHCLLITYSPTDDGAYTHFFLSQWDNQDSSYHYGMRSSAHTRWSRKGRWPLVAHIPGDSSTSDWRLYWGRKSVWLDGAFGRQYEIPLSIRGSLLVHKKPFIIREIYPNIQTLFSYLYVYHVPQDATEKNAIIQLAEFTDASHLITKDNSKAIYWISFQSDVLLMEVLLEMDQAGKLTILGLNDYTVQPNNNYRFELEQDPYWQSQHSLKSYGLGITMYNGLTEISTLRPRIHDQEIQAGKNSFWMGGIEAVMADGRRALGNMYIFTR